MFPEKSSPHHSGPFIILSTAIVIVIFIAIIVVLGASKGSEQLVEDTSSEERTVQTDVDLSKGSSLPPGFPANIPVEVGGIVQSYRRVYVDRDLTTFAVYYLTSKSVSEKIAEYQAFMTASGYEAGSPTETEVATTLFGTKDTVDIYVMITAEGDKRLVRLTYGERE